MEFILKQIFIYQKIIINKLLPKCLLYTFFEHCIILGWGSRSFIKSEHRGSYIMFKILGTRMVFILHHHPSSSIQCLSLCFYKPEMCKKVVHVYLPIIDVYIKFDFYRLCLQQPRSVHMSYWSLQINLIQLYGLHSAYLTNNWPLNIIGIHAKFLITGDLNRT